MNKDNKIPTKEFNRGIKELNAESVENTLLGILGKKMIGNSVMSSEMMGKQADFAESAFRMMGESIRELALKNGLDPIPDTAGVGIRDDRFGQKTGWEAKVYAHFSLDPIRFIIFCAYQQDEMRTKLETTKDELERLRKEHSKIVDIIRETGPATPALGQISDILWPEADS